MRQSLVICAIVLIGTLGCQAKSNSPTAPELQNLNYHGSVSSAGPHNPDGSMFVPAGFPAGGTWNQIDETHWKYSVSVDKFDAKLQTVKVGKIEVVAVCDYPLSFVGPLPYGHCYTDGSGCSL